MEGKLWGKERTRGGLRDAVGRAGHGGAPAAECLERTLKKRNEDTED